jgi:hypothetical protein
MLNIRDILKDLPFDDDLGLRRAIEDLDISNRKLQAIKAEAARTSPHNDGFYV